MINLTFGYELFRCWLSCEMWPTDYLDFLGQIDTDEEHF